MGPSAIVVRGRGYCIEGITIHPDVDRYVECSSIVDTSLSIQFRSHTESVVLGTYVLGKVVDLDR